jgi:hypothetical protein
MATACKLHRAVRIQLMLYFFLGMTNAEVLHQVEHGYRMQAPQGCPPLLYDIMLECWHKASPHKKNYIYTVYIYIYLQCYGSGMFYPGPGFLAFLSRIPDPGGEKASDPGSRIPILLYTKIGMKNKTNFFLAFYSFRSKFYK